MPTRVGTHIEFIQIKITIITGELLIMTFQWTLHLSLINTSRRVFDEIYNWYFWPIGIDNTEVVKFIFHI